MKPVLRINQYNVWHETEKVRIGHVIRDQTGQYHASRWSGIPLGVYHSKAEAVEAVVKYWKENPKEDGLNQFFPMRPVIRIGSYDVWHETKDVRIGWIYRLLNSEYRAVDGFNNCIGQFRNRSEAAQGVVREYLKDPAKKDRYPWL